MEAQSPMQETVYWTNTGSEENNGMSEKVQSLAGSIYQEFQRMITKYDEDVVKQLMPLIVSVLEHLDLAFVENQEHEVELELIKEDNEQLVTQFEREKQLRKQAEQRLLEVEYSVDDDRRDLQGKVESLESIVRMLELKSKNSADHASRLEEKETEMKNEYAKLHERYTELFKTHVDYMERTKILFGAEKAENISSKIRQGTNIAQMKSGGSVYSMNSEDSSLKSLNSPADFPSLTLPTDADGVANKNLQSELQDVQSASSAVPVTHPQSGVQKGSWTDGFGSDFTDFSISSTPEVEEMADLPEDSSPSHTTVKNEERRPNTLYQEVSYKEGSIDVEEMSDITGMGREVENLIMENSELLATKNALNIVKDDLIAKVDELSSEMEILQEEIKSLQAIKERLRHRVIELEDELKKTKEAAEKAKAKAEEEEEVPMAQRKRFTRVEMARVLMERNQYKERLMELQEAVRFTEMMRASKNDPTLDKKNQSSIRKFFSNLFSSSSERTQKRQSALTYSCSAHNIPSMDSYRKDRPEERHRGLDFLDSDLASERLQQQRAKERKEQYKQVKAHVQKEDGRMQAYGWSVPNRCGSEDRREENPESVKPSNSPRVPVPIYCRPLMDKEPGMKLWSAAGVNLTGGKTADGGSIVGASVFYSLPPEKESAPNTESLTEIEKLDNELKQQDQSRREHQEIEQHLSSLVWIGSSSHSNSKINVIDAKNPGDILSTFHVCSSHLLCIASVPGATENDYCVDDEFCKLGLTVDNQSEKSVDNEESGDRENSPSRIGDITFVSCSTGSTSGPPSPELSEQEKTDSEKGSEKQQKQWLIMKEPSEIVKDGVSELSKENQLAYDQIQKMSSVLPTIWMGAQNGCIYIHSAVAHWWRCIHTVKVKDAVLNIAHIKGRVFAAMANGTVAIFHRAADGQWDLTNYHILDLGHPHHSIRCMVVVHNKVWCGYRNRIHVVDPKTLSVENSFDVHPRKESQVRLMAWVGDGVWVSIRLDSTLRLYHAHTHEHLQDVDIEPYVSKMLGTGKLGFSFVRITSLIVSCNRLWMGTGNGVIISVPLGETSREQSPVGNRFPGTAVRVYADSKDNVTPGSYIPYCSMSQAQLSFHGHRDAVRFFVAVPGGEAGKSSVDNDVKQEDKQQHSLLEKSCPKYMYVLSGGEGYIDFRIGDGEDDGGDTLSVPAGDKKQSSLSKSEQSHLIVWHVELGNSY